MEGPVGEVAAMPLDIPCFVCTSALPCRVAEQLARRLECVLEVGSRLEALYLCAECNLKLLQIEQLITELQKIYKEKGANLTKPEQCVPLVSNSTGESIKKELTPVDTGVTVKPAADASDNEDNRDDAADIEAVSAAKRQKLDCGCGATFSTQRNLEIHRRDNHGGGVVCRQCGLALTDPEEITKHTCAPSTDSFKCLERKCGCGATEFATVAELRAHRQTAHAGRFVCEVCKKTYHSNSHLLRHHQQMHARAIDKKPIPQRKSLRERKATAAIRKVEDDDKAPDTQERPLTARQRAMRKAREAAPTPKQTDDHTEKHDEKKTEDDVPKPVEKTEAAAKNDIELQDGTRHQVAGSTDEYLCPACDVTFPGHATWENHIQTYHWWCSGLLYQCALCSDMKNNLKEIAEHAQVHRNIMHACQQCPAMFPPERGYSLRHRLVEHCTDRTSPKENPFCEQCGQEMLSASDLAFHQLMLHDVNVPVRRRYSRNPQSFHSCNYCPHSFTSDRDLIRHILDVHVQDSQLAQSEDYLLMEEEEEETSTTSATPAEDTTEGIIGVSDTARTPVKKPTPNVDVPGPPYTCGVCHHSCKSASTYFVHKNHFCMGNRAGDGSARKPSKKEYLCSLCGTVLTTSSGFRQHMANHNNKNRYACDICAKTFAILSQLNFHRKQHRRSFVCQECGNRFKTLSHLTDHQITHSTKMNFPCDMCDVRFKWRPTLVRHKFKVHGHGEKPHHSGMRKMLCTLCNMQISSGTRTKHFKRRHKDLPYELKYFTLVSKAPKDTMQPPQQGVSESMAEELPSPPQPVYVAPEATVKLTLPSMERSLDVVETSLTQPTPQPELHNAILSQQQQYLVSSVNQITPSLPTATSTSAYLSKFPLEALPEHVVSKDHAKLTGVVPQDQVTFDVVNMPTLEGESHYQVVQDASGMRALIIQPTWQTVNAPQTDTLPS